jgi:putative chitinase
MISIATLIGAGIAPTQARQWAGALAAAALRFGIDRPVREAAWVSQCAHESAGFTHLEENLFYTTAERVRQMWPTRVPSLDVAATLLRNPKALANRVYANRNGNGDEASGDGWAYRGRGLLQLTGRANYLAAAAALDQPYKSQPDLVSQPPHAAMTAAWFFVSANGLVLADASNIDALTRAINGAAMAGRDDRRQRFEQAVRAFA